MSMPLNLAFFGGIQILCFPTTTEKQQRHSYEL